jgi:hypothetical protein
MNEDIFWKIIESFNWNKDDDDEVMKPAIKRLSSMTLEDIYHFEDILSEKLYLLDGIEYAQNMGEYSYKGDKEHFSPDAFLYARCCVVANGKEIFEIILNNPEEMLEDADFESILYLAEEAYFKKTKDDDYDHETKFNYETFSNIEGWNPPEKPKIWNWKFWKK